uniref:Plac8 onzin related protein 1 n=1 Tax=Amphiprion percula TaxID=161767 RepID=A0A3P8SPQ3_AMPPE
HAYIRTYNVSTQRTCPLTNWNTGLFGCCEDMSSCCYGFWCCPCLACTVAGKFDENRCLPLCDICSPSVVGIRHKYGIKSSLCKDIATSCVCVWCSYCQMHRELKYRKKNSNVVVLQPLIKYSTENNICG